MSGVRLTGAEYLTKSWLLTDFCRNRGLAALPVGQPLWRLRCKADEVVRMQRLLETHLRGFLDASPYLSGMFCLYAAETLRRNYAGGPRSWQLVTDRLSPRLSQTEWRALTEAGLRFWQRPLRIGLADGRQFLHSLALEGGIPDSLLSGNTKVITQFLRRLLADVEAYGARDVADALRLAQGSAAPLPQAWQVDDILEMAASLTLEIARIRGLVRGQSPVVWFAEHPGWAEMLPVDIGQQHVLALIQGLVVQPRLAVRLDRLCQRVLIRRDGVWQPGFRLEANGTVPDALLPAGWFADEAVDRVRLVLDSGREAGRPLAVIERLGGGEKRFRALQDGVMRVAADEDVRVRVVRQGVEGETVTLPGGRALPDGPWVLMDDGGATDAAPEWLSFIGSGSTSSRLARLFLAVDPASGSLGGGPAESCGFVAETRRLVHLLTERCVWSGLDDIALRLAPGAAKDETHPLGLVPVRPSWRVDVAHVSHGAPGVLRPSGAAGPSLQWRSSAEMPWRKPAPWPEGLVTLAMIGADGVIWDMEALLILPATARIRAERAGDRATRIRVEGLGTDIAVEGLEVAARTAIPGGVELRIAWPDLPKPTVTLRIPIGPQRVEVRHIVSVPLAAGAFYDDDSQRLPRDVALRFGQLSQYHAVSGGLPGAQAELLVRVRGGQHPTEPAAAEVGQAIAFIDALPLHGIRRRLLRQFATHGQLDAEARVELLRDGIVGGRFKLSPYQHRLFVQRATASCGCAPPNESLSLAALALARPATPPVPLERLADGGWSLAALDRTEAWLIVGVGDSRGTVRATAWGGDAAAEAPGLAGFAGIADHPTRQAAILRRLDAITADPDQASSRLDMQYLRDLRHATRRLEVPALALDMLRQLAGHPACLWQLLEHSDEAGLQAVIDLEDELPFLWCLVPSAPLVALLSRRMAELRRLRLPEALVIDVMKVKLEALTALCPQLKAACWVAREALGLPHATDDGSLAMLCRPEIMRRLEAGLPRVHLSPAGWRHEVETVRDWLNLPPPVFDMAPIMAGAKLAVGQTLDPLDIKAMRHCRDRNEERFDELFRLAFHLAIAKAGRLPLENSCP